VKIKKILALTAGLYVLVGLALALAVLTTGGLILAVKPENGPGHWELVAPSGIDFGCGGGTYSHTLNTVSNNDPSKGMFTGSGTYDPNPLYTWDIDGEISGDDISFTLVYTGINAGYTLHGVGTIGSDGSISGTTDGNCQTFSMGAGSAVWKGPAKVDICHREGNGSYHLISVSEKAIPAHEEHGDAYPGDLVDGGVLDEDCSLLVPIRYTSSPMNYSGTGWGGWSCHQAHPTAVAGGWLPEAAVVGPHGLAVPGATIGGFTYPTFPHYTFGSWYAGETGFVLQNGGTAQTLTLWVDCL